MSPPQPVGPAHANTVPALSRRSILRTTDSNHGKTCSEPRVRVSGSPPQPPDCWGGGERGEERGEKVGPREQMLGPSRVANVQSRRVIGVVSARC